MTIILSRLRWIEAPDFDWLGEPYLPADSLVKKNRLNNMMNRALARRLGLDGGRIRRERDGRRPKKSALLYLEALFA